MKIIKYIPNMLSTLRILLSLTLLYFAYADSRVTFAVVYLIVGLTDVLDGEIARRFNVVSDLGSKLDAWGDSMLFGAGFICLFFLADHLRPEAPLKFLIAIVPAIIYKLANVAVTKLRFGEWNMMHTTFNRYVFVGVYFLVPIIFIRQGMDFWLIAAFSAAICLACFEETVTLLRMESYDVNNKGIVGGRIHKKALKIAKRSA